jgi:aminoglycoside phosphotransferase (APT) family kinase protein
MASEARTMDYLHRCGYPVPAIEKISDDGFDLVMERIDGPTMMQAISGSPWMVRRLSHVLADLHVRLHEVPPPEFLPPLSDRTGTEVLSGNSVLHLDLHPLNVIMGRKGPVVIDWSSVALGDPDFDVGLAWIIIAAGEIPAGRLMSTVLGWGRSLLINGFMSGFDRQAIAGKLRDIAAAKLKDPHMTTKEADRMWRAVERVERRASRR